MLRAVAIAAILCTTAAAQPVPSVDVIVQYRGAIKGADPADPRSIEAAIKAIDLATKAKKTAILPDLAALLARPVDKRLISAQVAAAAAIPKLGAEAKASVDALTPVLDRKFPKVGPNNDGLALHLAIAGSAVNALAELGDPRARVEIGGFCKTDQRCYAELLSNKPDSIVGRMRSIIKDVETWTPQEKLDLWLATIDRAMIDLSKRGTVKPEVLDKLLAVAGTPERVVRQGILIVLARAAPRPCPACVTKLDEVIEADRTKSLGDLAVDTALVRNYLRWAR